jgi:hypothetical protein
MKCWFEGQALMAFANQSRRAFLRNAAFSLGGLSLSNVLAGRAAAGNTQLDTSVILLYLHGGPSQLETYDLKPDAPIEYRSVFNSIPTNVSGMDICELFPLQAKIADKFSLVRSLNHDVNIHSDGGIVVLTGKRPRCSIRHRSRKAIIPTSGLSPVACEATVPLRCRLCCDPAADVHDSPDLPGLSPRGPRRVRTPTRRGSCRLRKQKGTEPTIRRATGGS